MNSLSKYLLLMLCFILAGCAQTTSDASKGAYKVGTPYVVNGKKYYPRVDYEYSETGLASWYGPGFDGKKTANGERFNQNELTAAHRTLPMPSFVRVTNLENGKSVIVRINDRGPFSKNRIIDVSKKAAELLGFKNKGVAKVRVDIMEEESRRIADAAMKGYNTRGKGFIPDQQPQNYQTASTQQPKAIPVHMTNGKYYPDPVVSQQQIGPTNVYVQVGAFSVQENAHKLLQEVSSFGEAKIKPITTNGKQFFRVRIPARNAVEADALMTNILKAGYKNAVIVIE